MAAPDRLGDAAQALVRQALGGEVLDDGVEQRRGPWPPPLRPVLPTPPLEVGRSLVRACTIWYTRSGPSRTEGPDEEGSHGPAGDRRDGGDERGPASVYALLADGSTWPEWSPIDAFTLIDPGAGTPEGLGAVRLFTTGRHRSRERVVECRPGEVFAYVLEKGLPLRDYKAVITLTPMAGGTSINWHSTFRPKMPGTGWLYRRELGKFIRQTVDGLAAAADRAASGPCRNRHRARAFENVPSHRVTPPQS